MSPSSVLHGFGSRRILEKSLRIGAPYTRFNLSDNAAEATSSPIFSTGSPQSCASLAAGLTASAVLTVFPYKDSDAVAKPCFLGVEHQGIFPGSPAVKYRHYFFIGMYFPRENPPHIRLAFRSPSRSFSTGSSRRLKPNNAMHSSSRATSLIPRFRALRHKSSTTRFSPAFGRKPPVAPSSSRAATTTVPCF